jgi:O-6-methylguanine DNA methyltransferase
MRIIALTEMSSSKPITGSRKAVITILENTGEVCGTTIRIPSLEIVSTTLPQPDFDRAFIALEKKLKGRRYTLVKEDEASPMEKKYLTEAYKRGRKISAMIFEYCRGKDIQFSEKLDLSGMTAFKREVLLAVKSIPKGKTASYSWIAEKTGYPEACRAVGNVMATNPFPPIVPCHRVVRSSREIGNFGSGIELKRRMLIQERVVFDGEKIAIDCFLT